MIPPPPDRPRGRRPTLLFLAYFFPPARTIASVRSHAIAKWLVRFGWDVTVVTPNAAVWRRTENRGGVDRLLEAEGIRCVRTRHPWRSLASGHVAAFYDGTGPIGERIGSKLASLGRSVAGRLNLAPEFGWIAEVERVCSRRGSGSTDLILATGSPFAAFGAAQRLSRRLDCPYVLDYRDPWSGNPYVEESASPSHVERERSVLEASAAAIAVSPGVVKVLQKLFGIGSKVSAITNGYDSEELSSVAPQDFKHFAIVYAGHFYPPKRDVTPLLAALVRLETAGGAARGWMFHYYGRHEKHVRDAARQCGVEDRIILHGEVTRNEALAAVRGAGMAVVVGSVARQATLQDEGIVTGKVFEAIGLRTPILAIAPPGSDLEGVLATAGLGRRFSGDEIGPMASYLSEAIAGRAPSPNEPEAFDWIRIGAQLDRVLRGALARSGASAATPAPTISNFI